MMVQYLEEFIESPIFIIESSYDLYSVQAILNLSCTKDRNLFDCTPQERDYLDQYAT
jgi:O-palmitoleoyl-L-serine hydrolase